MLKAPLTPNFRQDLVGAARVGPPPHLPGNLRRGRLHRASPNDICRLLPIRRKLIAPLAHEHAFNQSYYQLLDTTRGRPFGVYIHGNEGTEGAERGIAAITTGLGWVKAAETVVVMGKPTKADVEACWNLGATVAAQLMG
jgi:hypothetical protein